MQFLALTEWLVALCRTFAKFSHNKTTRYSREYEQVLALPWETDLNRISGNPLMHNPGPNTLYDWSSISMQAHLLV